MSLRLYARPFAIRNASPFFLRRNSNVRPQLLRQFGGFGSHLAVGVAAYTAGVLSVFAAGYALYSYSGIKRAVDTFSPAMKFLGQTQDRLSKDRIPSHALNYLRQAAKAYVAYIPGAGFIVDQTFDHIDNAVDLHAEKANAIIAQAYNDLLQIVQIGGNRHEAFSALEILSVCRRLLNELGALGVKAGKPLADTIELDKRLAAASATAGSVIETIKTKSPEWRQSLDDVTAKGVRSASSGIGSAASSIRAKFMTQDPKEPPPAAEEKNSQ